MNARMIEDAKVVLQISQINRNITRIWQINGATFLCIRGSDL